MPQVMEGQSLDAGGLADPLEGLGDRIGAHAPHPAIDAPGDLVQDSQCRRGERHPPGRPGLRLGDQQDARLPVQVVPAHGRDLPAAHGGFDRPGDDVGDTDARMGARVISQCGCQEAGLLVADQAAVASTGELGALALDEIHGVRQGLHAPGGAGDVEQVGEKIDFFVDRRRGRAFLAALFDVIRDVLASDGGQGPLCVVVGCPSIQPEPLDAGAFLGRRNLSSVAVQGLGQGRRLRFGARDENPSGDLGLDRDRPGLRLGLSVECADLRGITPPTDMRLPYALTTWTLSRNERRHAVPPQTPGSGGYSTSICDTVTAPLQQSPGDGGGECR